MNKMYGFQYNIFQIFTHISENRNSWHLASIPTEINDKSSVKNYF